MECFEELIAIELANYLRKNNVEHVSNSAFCIWAPNAFDIHYQPSAYTIDGEPFDYWPGLGLPMGSLMFIPFHGEDLTRIISIADPNCFDKVLQMIRRELDET